AGSSGAPALLTLHDNVVLRPATTPIQIGDLGPLLLFDNRIHTPGQPAVRFEKAQGGLVSAGNVFSTDAPYQGTTNVLAFDNRMLPRSKFQVFVPASIFVPPAATGAVIESPTNATRLAIQQTIDGAAGMSGLHPVLHLPAGVYPIDQPLVVPARSDLRLAG